MKNLFAGVLMSALCAGFVACNEPVGQGQNEEGTEIQPVPVSELSDEVAAYLDENVSIIGNAIFYEYNDFETREFVDACVAINSVEEFEQIDFRGETPPELPAIDFNSHTLVIGQWVGAEDARFYLMSRSLVVEHGIVTMDITIELDKGLWDAYYRLYPKYFWGLYPKIAAETIRMNVAYLSKIFKL